MHVEPLHYVYSPPPSKPPGDAEPAAPEVEASPAQLLEFHAGPVPDWRPLRSHHTPPDPHPALPPPAATPPLGQMAAQVLHRRKMEEGRGGGERPGDRKET